jgi:phage N-6-adenine-methyltransferase
MGREAVSLVGFKARNHPQQGVRDEVDDRGTPTEFVASIEERFGRFTLDVAAAPHNAKCERYYTRADDGLALPWAGNVWCNPPYSGLDAWCAKAWAEWATGVPELIVMLLPANRCEQPWWQTHLEPHRDRPGSPLSIEFLPGRLRFIKAGATSIEPNERPPFGCVLAIWNTRT